MAAKSRGLLILGLVGVAALVAIVLVVSALWSGLPQGTNTPPAGGQRTATAGWAVVPAPPLLVKAEDALGLDGKMALEEGLDNEQVTGSSGQRAKVRFVGVEDKACAKGEDPAVHKARFELVVKQPGSYYPWARVWWKDSCGDSIAVLIQHRDDGEPTRWEITDGTHGWWHWLPLAGSSGVELKQGSYAVIVGNREDGARLSRILFSLKDYETYMPSGPEG